MIVQDEYNTTLLFIIHFSEYIGLQATFILYNLYMYI